LLPEELSSYLENVVEPDVKAPNLTPFQMDSVVWLFIGSVVGMLGALVFLFGLAFFALDPSQSRPPQINITSTDKLPLAQWQNMMSQLNGKNYIAAMRFQNNEWAFEMKDNTVAAPPSTLPPPGPVTLEAPANLQENVPDPMMAPPNMAPAPPPPEPQISQPAGPIVMTPGEAPTDAPVPPPTATGMPETP
jgi:hypothetical protein